MPATTDAPHAHDGGHRPTIPATRILRRGERRASILAGAASAFSHSGFAATSMESIAESSGVSKLILYRHFDSKEALYRSVVERVALRLAESFAEMAGRGEQSEVPARAFLTVAREDPEGFRLLWRHSAREPQFAEYVERFRALAVSFARALLAPRVRDASLHEWAAQTIVDVLVDSVLNWLDHGDEARDDEFVDRSTRSLQALVLAWDELD